MKKSNDSETPKTKSPKKVFQKIFSQQHAMREQNRYLVLDAIARGLRSRRQIQRDTGLAWGTVSNCVSQLEDEQVLILEDELRENCFSIPPKQLHGSNSYCYFNQDKNLLAGLEIGSNRLELRVCTPDRSFQKSFSASTGNISDEYALRNTVEQFLKDKGIVTGAIAAFGVALTGAFRKEIGTWIKTSHLPQVDHWDLRILSEILPNAKLILEHDIVSKARSVNMIRNDFGHDFAFFHIGDGIGLTLCRNGIFQEGVHGFAGEIGHIPYPYPNTLDSENCKVCGKPECLENIVSLRGLRTYSKQVHGSDTLLPEKQVLWDFLKPHLLWSCVAATNLFDPGCLILGGETLDLFPDQLQELPELIKKNSWMNGPENVKFYQMCDCDTALGVTFSARDQVLSAIASNC